MLLAAGSSVPCHRMVLLLTYLLSCDCIYHLVAHITNSVLLSGSTGNEVEHWIRIQILSLCASVIPASPRLTPLLIRKTRCFASITHPRVAKHAMVLNLAFGAHVNTRGRLTVTLTAELSLSYLSRPALRPSLRQSARRRATVTCLLLGLPKMSGRVWRAIRACPRPCY